ncbi:MAG: HXXEE domain-containing protein [Anaerolineaceae bacterium]|nr:HXXEE domain-containing protein [Anaerolineaceae bacterium]
MNTVITFFEQYSFLHLIVLFFLFFVIHEVEEWNINTFEHRNFEGVPAAATNKSARLWIAFICLVGLVWFGAAFLSGNPSTAAWIILPALGIVMQNAFQHVIWSIYFRQYVPGLVSAFFLLIPFSGYLMMIAVQRNYIPLWYGILCVVPVVLGIIQTIRAGNKMPPFIQAINRLGIYLSEKLG